MVSHKKFPILKDNRTLILLCLFLFVAYVLYKNIVGSVYLRKKDRINVVFYGSHTVFYSLGKNDISYFFTIPSNVEVEIPGGYGQYRIGALGKLVSLEKKNEIFKKVFSAATSSFVDLYFYPKTNAIYYGNASTQKFIPSATMILLNSSNANLIDRLLLWFFFLQKPTNQFKEISDLPQEKESNKALFDRIGFFKEYQGFFYEKAYRIISDRVQILYTENYKTALLISNILEGEGIQVVDLSQNKKSQRGCKVIYNIQNTNDVTPRDIKTFFGCTIEKGETDVSDIILILGDLEKGWSVE